MYMYYNAKNGNTDWNSLITRYNDEELKELIEEYNINIVGPTGILKPHITIIVNGVEKYVTSRNMRRIKTILRDNTINEIIDVENE